MTSEFWINNESDFKELKLYLEDKKYEIIGEDDEGNEIIVVDNLKIYKPKSFKIVKETLKYNPLIFGKDQTEGIVNISVNNNETADIYLNDGTCKTIKYRKWAIGAQYQPGAKKLEGNQFYRYYKELTERQYEYLKSQWNYKIWIPRTPEEGFMIRNGYTYYKGLKINEVSLYSMDIEATSLDPDEPGSEIVLMSRTYRNRYGQLETRMFDIFEYDTIDEFFHDISKDIENCNPDIILGHNIFGYDLPYLNAKCPTDLFWGRNGSSVVFDERASKKRKDGSQSYEFYNAKIHGREIIDTLFLSISYDIARNFPSYGLKAIEKYLNLVDSNRIEWDFQKWPVKKIVKERRKGTSEGKRVWDLFRQYCQDDTLSPIKMFDIMCPSFFYLAQSIPKTMQQMINEATGSQIDTVMIRSYLQNNHSIPKSSKTIDFEGAVSMGIPGIYRHVLKFDVASLYPSIMLEYNIYDRKKDPKRHMLQLLEYFRDERLKNKKLAKETGDVYYDNLQASQKIFINSLYGFLGANYLLYNTPKCAEEVTKYGREINLKGIEWATGRQLIKEVKGVINEGTDEERTTYHWVLGDKVSEGKGYTLVNTDTDSFSMTNGKEHTKEEFNALIDDLNSNFSDMIDWEDDSQFKNFIVIAAKNYIMVKNKNWCKPDELDENGNPKVKYKGSSLTDQKKEPILIEFLHELINIILKATDNDKMHEDLIKCHIKYCKMAINVKDISKWVTKKTITNKMLSKTTTASKKACAAFEEAIEKGIIDGVQEGDKIWVYQYIKPEKVQQVIKGQPVFLKDGAPKMIDENALRFPELFDGNYDKWHYVKRVWATLSILSNIIDMNRFTNYALKKNRNLLNECS